MFIRRSRGSAPTAIPLAQDGPVVLALGGHLKVTACVLRGAEALLTPHVGDLDHPEAVEALEEAVEQLLRLTGARPAIVAHDLHPDFASTLLAERLAARFDAPTLAVQHHHAHIAAVAAEHGVRACLGLALDGFGLGEPSDSGETRAWGGELLHIEGANSLRLGALADLVEPGGDQAAREPWRMAAGVLAALGRGDEISRRFAGQPRAGPLGELLGNPNACTGATTSAGRLFDAVAGLLNVTPVNRFEAEAAMRLEALTETPRVQPGGYVIRKHADSVDRLDLGPLLAFIADHGDDQRLGAELFHGTLAEGLAELAARRWRPGMPRTVALGGGCFLNRRLTEAMIAALGARDFTPLIARRAPPNDGGLALGQAAVARAFLLKEQGA
jgi:hydrogenase maturation protein HypF